MPVTEQTTTEVVIREDEDDPVVWEAVRSFQKTPTRENTEAVLRLLNEKLERWDSHPAGLITTILEAIAEHQVEVGLVYLVRFVNHDPALPSSAHVASYAAMALGKLGGDGAFEALVRAAESGPPEILDSVAVALGLLKDRRGVPILEALAIRHEPAIRAETLTALAKYCFASSKPLAVNALDDANDRVRANATWWLAQCGDEGDAQNLAKALGDPAELGRANALRGLTRLNNRAGCGSLSALLVDESPTVREMAHAYDRVCHEG